MTVNQAFVRLIYILGKHGDLPMVHVCAFCRKTSESDLFEVNEGRVELHDEPTTRFLTAPSGDRSPSGSPDTT